MLLFNGKKILQGEAKRRPHHEKQYALEKVV
jgi:hypothetical protein